MVEFSLSSTLRQIISLNDRRGGGVGEGVVRIRCMRSSGVSGRMGNMRLAASAGDGIRTGRVGGGTSTAGRGPA